MCFLLWAWGEMCPTPVGKVESISLAHALQKFHCLGSTDFPWLLPFPLSSGLVPSLTLRTAESPGRKSPLLHSALPEPQAEICPVPPDSTCVWQLV